MGKAARVKRSSEIENFRRSNSVCFFLRDYEMKHILDISLSFILASVLVCAACVQAEGDRSVNIVPWPRSIESSGRIATVEPKIYLGENSLTSLSEVLNENIYRITDSRCKVVSSQPGSGIIFERTPDMKPGAYSLTVKGKRCVLRAG